MSAIYPHTLSEDLSAIAERCKSIGDLRVLSVVFTVIVEGSDAEHVVSYGRDTRPVDRTERLPLSQSAE